MMKRRTKSRGMTLVEVMITTVVLAVSLGGFSMAVVTTQKSSLTMRGRDMVKAQAMKYMERLLRIPFGTATDPAASSTQVAEMFDDNAVVTGGAPVTLKSLETAVGSSGWRFRVEGFEMKGVWEVEINTDLDGNGTANGVRGTGVPTTGNATAPAGDGTTISTLQSEGDGNMLRVEIFWNGQSVLRCLRAATVEGS